MHLAELWRYPVKSMAGERLQAIDLGPLGVPGDREVYVVDDLGRILTARNHPRLLTHHATIDTDGRPRVDGLPWQDLEVSRKVREAAGEDAHLVQARAGERFDVMPLLVATDGAVAELGTDRRRLRPNLLIGGVEGLAEREWEGRFLRIGSAVVGLDSLRERCVMTTWDPDTIEHDPEVLRRIQQRFGGKIALNAWVAQPGRVAVDDLVELLDSFADARPPILGRSAM